MKNISFHFSCLCPIDFRFLNFFAVFFVSLFVDSKVNREVGRGTGSFEFIMKKLLF